MGRAIQAIMAQAGAWVAQYKSDLTARGLGFTPDDSQSHWRSQLMEDLAACETVLTAAAARDSLSSKRGALPRRL